MTVCDILSCASAENKFIIADSAGSELAWRNRCSSYDTKWYFNTNKYTWEELLNQEVFRVEIKNNPKYPNLIVRVKNI